MPLISEWRCPVCGHDKCYLSSHDHPQGGEIPKQCGGCSVMFEDDKKFNAYKDRGPITDDEMVSTLRERGYMVQEPSTIFLLKEKYKGTSKPSYSLRTTTRGFGLRLQGCDELEYAEIDPETLNWTKYTSGD